MKDYVNVKKPSKKLPTKTDWILMAIFTPLFVAALIGAFYMGVPA